MFWVIGACNAQNDPLAAQRLAFSAVDQALRNGARVPLEPFRDYPLYPYLLYRDLQRRLADYPVGEVQAFLRTQADTPLSSRLRTAWLRQLAIAQRWSEWLRDYQTSDSVELDCWRRQALIHTGQPSEALVALDRVWLSATALPTACDPVIALWQRQGGLTSDHVWKRFILAMEKGETGVARQVKTLLPLSEQFQAESWLQVGDNARLVLEADRFDAAHPRTPPLILFGVQRWGNDDPVAAAAALDTLKTRYRLPAEPLAELERRLALFVASRGDPSALERLNRLPPTVVNTPVREWRVRVGLQRGDWQLALTGLDQLQPAESQLPVWRYWRGRALAALGQAEAARAVYQDLAKQRDFHGFLAADILASPYQLHDIALASNPTGVDAIARRPSALRARELFRLGRYAEARVEWRYTTTPLSREELRQAAQLAQSWEWHDQAIITLAAAESWDDLHLRFPLTYADQINLRAREYNLDPAWLYAIMRQESAFQVDARSAAGALGLMQIIPTTGRDIASELQLDRPADFDLLRTDLNIRFGAHYLRHTLDRLAGNPTLATAAYNAGPARVSSWLPPRETMEPDRWIELIPYAETRNYVKRIMEYTTIYERRLGREGNSLTARLGVIAPAP